MKHSTNIKKISRGKYIVNGCRVEYYQNARYNLFDGKYHPGWIVTAPNGIEYVSIDKQSAFNTAFKVIG